MTQVLDGRPGVAVSQMEQSGQSRNNIYALERDLFHGQFCYDNDYQFTFEVLNDPNIFIFMSKTRLPQDTEAYDVNNGPSVMREMPSRVPEVAFFKDEVRVVRVGS